MAAVVDRIFQVVLEVEMEFGHGQYFVVVAVLGQFHRNIQPETKGLFQFEASMKIRLA
jgi:hypothetical protein